MNILCATDDAYVPWCGVMLTSLFENNKSHQITVYVLTQKLSDQNCSIFRQLGEKYGQTINIVTTDDVDFEICPIKETDHVSIATYLRLAAPHLLPNDVEKIIYLDCDIIVSGDLGALWDLDISGYALGVVYDEAYQDDEKYITLGLEKRRRYFNAGVLLMNLKYFRKHDVMTRCFQVIKDIPERLLFHDQDTLNVVLEQECINIHPRFNLQTGFLFTTVSFDKDTQKQIREAIEAPVIIHFTGYNKPWQENSSTPFVPFFRHYKEISLWKDTPLLSCKLNFKDRIRMFIFEVVWKLGIKKRPQSYIIPQQRLARK